VVTVVAITDENGADSPQFGPLVRKTDDRFTINKVSADVPDPSRLNR